MIKSVFIKIFGTYLVLTTLLCGLVILFAFYSIKDSHVEMAANDLTNLAVALKGEITPYVAGSNTQNLDARMKILGKQTQTRITVMALDGRILADSEEEPSKMENHQTRTEMAEALDGRLGRFIRMSGTLNKEMLYIAVPVTADGSKPLYVLRVSRFLGGISAITNRLITKIILATLIIDIFGVFFAFLFSRNVSGPVKELKAAFRKLSLKNFNVRVFLKRNDELKDLADVFNDMAVQMRNLFDELSHQKEELNGIISSLQEGLLVIDAEDKVLFANKSLTTVTEHEFKEGTRYWEVFRQPKLNDLIRQVRSSGQNLIEEVELNNRTFLCGITILAPNMEITVIFHDITEIKRLAKIKSDFVTNVSHELRTPLTSIKGFIEAIDSSTLNDENCRYLQILKRNTDRVINIVNDLLTLSDLERKTSDLQFETVNVKNVIESVLPIFERQIGDKGLVLDYSIASDVQPTIRGDRFRLEQVFINLLDNAVKYTEKGTITVRVEVLQRKIIVSVRDTGIGISSEDLPRVFERFYVADKSRSRRMGGTGLGLSIVKHIVRLHQGVIDVKSKPGEGTDFTVTLPVLNS